MTLKIGGIPADEYQRSQAMPLRSFTQADAPDEPWSSDFADLKVRENGDIVVGHLTVGKIDGRRVSWYK